ncbi:MAG: T9SS type A sorting domain-containing protein [Bacteroidia bacterium]
MKKTAFLFLLLGLTVSLQAQQVVNRQAQHILREKIRYEIKGFTPEKEHKIKENQASAAKTSSFANLNVSDDADLQESEIHAVINPLDSTNMVCSANFSSSSGGGAGTPINYIYYTRDFGQTWEKSLFQAVPLQSTNLVLGGGDPLFAADAQTGRLYFSWINLHAKPSFDSLFWDLSWAYSDDGGETWLRSSYPYIGQGKGDILALFSGNFVGGIRDKQWMMVDNSAQSSHKGNLYCAFLEAEGTNVAIGVRRKVLANANFDQTTAIVSTPDFQMVQFSGIETDNAGNVHVMFFGSKDTLTGYSMYHSVSTDAGLTFSAPNKISDVQVPSFSPGQAGGTIQGVASDRMYPCPSIEYNTKTGVLMTVWTANGVSSQVSSAVDVYFSRSTDGGTTWSTPIVVNSNPSTDATDQFYPSIEISSSGRTAIAWYDGRLDSGATQTHYYIAFTNDDGLTFYGEQAITDASTDFNTVGAQNADFGIGEYCEIVMTPNQAIPFWTDGRANDGELDIYAAIVPTDPAVVAIQPIIAITSGISLGLPSPNPVSERFQIKVNNITQTYSGTLSIFDTKGNKIKEVYAGNIEKGEKTFDVSVSGLAQGQYFIVLTAKGGISTQAFVVKR